MIRVVCFAFAAVFLWSCVSYKPSGSFEASRAPRVPRYADLSSWAAHPLLRDPSDSLPAYGNGLFLSNGDMDVFFIHPTTLTGSKRDHRVWNAAIDNATLNDKTDYSTILFQASIFNGAGRVYAPRYRQAHLHSYFTWDTVSANGALDVAYQDVKAAFDHYLEHWNLGKPFILAAHSQGAQHGVRLLSERVDGRPLQEQLVAAYLVGWPVPKNAFREIPPCVLPEDTGCFCSWRTWESRSGKKKPPSHGILCTNPLIWRIEEGVYAPDTLNKGGVLRSFHEFVPQATDAEVFAGLLLARRPHFKGSFFFRRKNYHIGDFNLYYLNVRENAVLRAQMHLNGK